MIELDSRRNPIVSGIGFWKRKITIDLKTGKLFPEFDSSLSKILKEKSEWFRDFVKKKNGNLNDFEKAEISIFGKKEKVLLIYNGKEFSSEKVW